MKNGSVGKILIVDDEIELKDILVEALSLQGYEAAGFSNGKDALDCLREEPFDILLTDLMMPGIDGITLVREALCIDPNLVCIVMTGQGTIQTAVDAMKIGAFDYALKPFRLQIMMPMLTRAMNTRHLRMENIQLREAVAIHEICETIAFTLDRQTILSKLADAALLQSNADEISVLLPVDNADEFYVAAVRGERRERLLGERIPFGDSISGWVAREHESLILDGPVDDSRFTALWPRPEIRSSLSIPMLVAKKLIGILNLNAIDRQRRFTLGEMKALTILAGTAAAALEISALYNRVRKAEAEYRSVFENAAEGICRTTPDGRFVTANPAMARILGYDSPEDLITGINDAGSQLYVDPNRRDEAIRLLKENNTLSGFDAEYRRKDGTVITVSISARAARDDKGEILYFEGVLQDVTERRRSEETLRASEAEMRALFDSMLDVIIVLDSEGRHLKMPTTRSQHLYRPAEERIGKTVYEVFPKETADLFLVKIKNALVKQQTQHVEYPLTINHEKLWYDASVSPIGEHTVLWVARDITDRKRAEEETESRRQEMERFNRLAVGRELRMIELKQLVNSLSTQLGKDEPYALEGFTDVLPQNAEEQSLN